MRTSRPRLGACHNCPGSWQRCRSGTPRWPLSGGRCSATQSSRSRCGWRSSLHQASRPTPSRSRQMGGSSHLSLRLTEYKASGSASSIRSGRSPCREPTTRSSRSGPRMGAPSGFSPWWQAAADQCIRRLPASPSRRDGWARRLVEPRRRDRVCADARRRIDAHFCRCRRFRQRRQGCQVGSVAIGGRSFCRTDAIFCSPRWGTETAAACFSGRSTKSTPVRLVDARGGG